MHRQLRNDNSLVQIKEYQNNKEEVLSIAYLENKAVVKRKYGELLYRLAKYFNAKNIVEIGTSIGISSAYISASNPDARIISLDNLSALTDLVIQNHALLKIRNVELKQGEFSGILNSSFQQLGFLDIIFFNRCFHESETLQHFYQCLNYITENSIFIFNNIYQDREANEMWIKIQQHPQISLTIDVFQFGICFFRKGKLAKENFVLRY